MYSKIVVVLLSLVSISFGQIVTNGPCKNLTAVNNFEISGLIGNWYEIKRYQIEGTPGSECLRAEFSAWNETVMAIDATGKNPATNLTEIYHGRMYEEFPGENIGIVNINMDDTPIEETLYFLVADPESYSLSWACFYIPDVDMNAQFMWVHARQPELTDDEKAIIDEAIDRFELDSSQLSDTIQDPEFCGM